MSVCRQRMNSSRNASARPSPAPQPAPTPTPPCFPRVFSHFLALRSPRAPSPSLLSPDPKPIQPVPYHSPPDVLKPSPQSSRSTCHTTLQLLATYSFPFAFLHLLLPPFPFAFAAALIFSFAMNGPPSSLPMLLVLLPFPVPLRLQSPLNQRREGGKDLSHPIIAVT